MNNYYIVQATNFINGDPEARGLFVHESLDEAQAAFHQTLASAMVNENVASCLCMILSHDGQATKSEYWERATEEPTEEE